MPYFLTFICAITCAIQSPIMKTFQNKRRTGIYLFTAMSTAISASFFFFSGLFTGGLHYNGGVLLYALLFSISAAVCNVTMQMALGCGSLALTALFSAYSLMIPTMYGLIFLHESLSPLGWVGIALLVVSLYLTNADFSKLGKNKKDATVTESGDTKEKKITAKWLIFAILSAVTNGLCSIIQRSQQIAFDGAYKNEMMSAAFGLAALFIVPLVVYYERHEIKEILKDATVPALGCGVANGTTNLLVMVVTASIATSIFFPIISAGSMIIAYVLSIVLFRERFSPYQHTGIALGVLSLVFLNI